ncbi:MAG: GumC family protein [Terriglobales bacterium]
MPNPNWTSSSLSFPAAMAVLRRRRWWLLLPLVGGWLAVVSLRTVLPAQYQSQALLLIEQQSVPQTYVQPNVTFNADRLLQSLGQQVLSHDRLAQVVRQHHLYPGLQARQGLDAAILKLRKAISIQPVSLNSLPHPLQGDWSAITIGFEAQTPALAQAVANDLTTMFIQDNLQATQQASAQTTTFLDQQLEQASAQLQQARQRVQTYERAHLGTLPGQTQVNLAMAMSLQSELASSTAALNRTQQEIASDRGLLAQAQTPAEQKKQQQLADLQTQLQQLHSRYTSRYPAVVALQQQIAALQKPAPAAAAAPGAHAAPAPGTDGDSLTLTQIRSQLQADEGLLPRQQKQVSALNRELQQYQHRLSLAPLPAAHLAGLQAQEQQAAAAYQSLLGKRNASQMASQLEAQQGGAQFRLLDAPALPQKPVSPKPGVLSVLGLACGLILGLGASAAAELSQDRLRTEAEIVALGLTPILARVPSLHSRRERNRKRLRARLEWAAGVVLVLVLVAGNIWMLRG